MRCGVAVSATVQTGRSEALTHDVERYMAGKRNEGSALLCLGRKSWLFAGSERGADRAAAMTTLIMTAELNFTISIDILRRRILVILNPKNNAGAA